jgi:hypothetical protein
MFFFSLCSQSFFTCVRGYLSSVDGYCLGFGLRAFTGISGKIQDTMVQRDRVWGKAMSGGLLHRSKEELALAHLMKIFHA